MKSDLTDKRVLITGASRGVGAALAEIMARRGADPVLNYRNKRPRAEAVAQRVQADITVPEDVERMMRDVEGLDVLVLNASGGLEKNQTPDYALRLNRDAQVDLAERALPLMPRGSRIVFVTSHLAHFYGEKPVFLGYEPVAESKRAGEDALRARIPLFAECGVSLMVVSVDLIEGTVTPKLLQRAVRGLSKRGAKRRAACRRLRCSPRPSPTPPPI